MIIKKFDGFLIKENLSFEEFKGAGHYGDGHPKGTYCAYNMPFVTVKQMAKDFDMVPYNASDDMTIDEMEFSGTDTSIGSFTDSETAFIYITKDGTDDYSLYVGPDSVDAVKEYFISGNKIDKIDFSDIDDYFLEISDNVSEVFQVRDLGISSIDVSKKITGRTFGIKMIFMEKWKHRTATEHIRSPNIFNKESTPLDRMKSSIKLQMSIIECIENLASQKGLEVVNISEKKIERDMWFTFSLIEKKNIS